MNIKSSMVWSFLTLFLCCHSLTPVLPQALLVAAATSFKSKGNKKERAMKMLYSKREHLACNYNKHRWCFLLFLHIIS